MIAYVNDNKLNSMCLKNNFYVIMDFDNTITKTGSTNSWSILENPEFMDSRLHVESTKFVEKYYPIELNYTLDYETKSAYMQEWYSINMNLYYKYGLTYEVLLNCVKSSNVQFRDGFKDFLQVLHDIHIPVIILSAGIGNVIYELFKLHGCLYDNVHIVSNFIKFENGAMLPFNDKIIHSCNKSLDKLPVDIHYSLKNLSNILLFGDLIEDLNMAPHENLKDTISFGFLESNVEENLNYYKNAFDVVLTNNASFYEIRDLIKM